MVDITAMGREPEVAWRHGWYSRHFLTREIFGNELPRASAKVSLLPPVSFSLRRTITFRPVDSTDAAEMIAVLQDAIKELHGQKNKNIPMKWEQAYWRAAGSEDTELGVSMELEVSHGETEVYARVQA